MPLTLSTCCVKAWIKRPAQYRTLHLLGGWCPRGRRMEIVNDPPTGCLSDRRRARKKFLNIDLTGHSTAVY